MEKHKTAEATRRLVKVLLAPDELGRPYIGPPGVPAERVKISREAFAKTMIDRDLLADAERRDWGINPTRGEELEATARELVSQPPEVIEGMRKLLAK